MMNLDKSKADYDIIVVGGGPAGCAFVRSLITFESGLRILLIEKDEFPRDKVCGDGLTYQAIPVVREVFPELESLTPSVSFTGGQVLCYPEGRCLFRQDQALDVIPRLEFDNALWRATVDAGAETLENVSVIGLLTEAGRVRGVKLRDANGSRELTCGLLVGADGSRSVVRRETGSTEHDNVIHALRQYVRGIPESTEGLIFFFDLEFWGYFWIFPFVRDGERWANVGYGNATDNRILKERFRHYCKSPEMKPYLGDGRFEGNLIGFPLNLAKFKWNGRLTRRLWGPGYLLLGDAASLIHPLSGEGIAFAIESGRIAAEVLVDNGIAQKKKGAVYERRVLRRVRPSFLSLTAFCAIRLPSLLPGWLSDAFVASAAFAQKHFGLGVRPPGRARIIRQSNHSRSIGSPRAANRHATAFAGLTLFVLLGALTAFWLARIFDIGALSDNYGTRANVFAAIATAFCLSDARRRYNWRFAFVFFAVAFVCSLAVELAGTSTGVLFGAYRYSEEMPGQLFGLVPVAVPVAWFVIFYLTSATSVTLLPPRATLLSRAAVATALLIAYDAVAATNHLYRGGWSYPNGGFFYGTPLQNFVACAVFGFVALIVLGLIERRELAPGKTERAFPLAWMAYVGLLLHEGLFAFLIAKHSAPAAIGFAISAVVVMGWFWRRREAISFLRRPSALV